MMVLSVFVCVIVPASSVDGRHRLDWDGRHGVRVSPESQHTATSQCRRPRASRAHHRMHHVRQHRELISNNNTSFL